MCHLSFLDYYVTYCYNRIFFSFSGRDLGRAPVRRFSLRMSPGTLKFLLSNKMRQNVHLMHMGILDRCVPSEKS